MTELSRKQAAALVGMSEQTIVGWQKSGHLRRPFTVDRVLAAQQVAHVGAVVPRWRADRVRAGQRLRALREAAGLTQQALGARAGITYEAISILEHGTRTASAPTVHKLSQALGVAPERFVDDTPIGVELLSVQDAGHRLDVPSERIRVWLLQGLLPGSKVNGRWRIPATAVADLERSDRLRDDSCRLDPRYRG